MVTNAVNKNTSSETLSATLPGVKQETLSQGLNRTSLSGDLTLGGGGGGGGRGQTAGTALGLNMTL